MLTLPAVALLGLASMLSLRVSSQRGPRIVKNEVVRVPNTGVLMHRISVTRNELPWWCQKILGGNDFAAAIQSSKCDQLRMIGINDFDDRDFRTRETLFDASEFQGKACFHSMVTWKRDANHQIRGKQVIVKETVVTKTSKPVTDEVK